MSQPDEEARVAQDSEQKPLTDGGERSTECAPSIRDLAHKQRNDSEIVGAHLPTCGNCGETFLHETTAGPGKSRRSCGCPITIHEVPDDTENAFANAAIRAANVTNDAETAMEVREGARGRLVTDGGVPETFDELASTCENCGDDVDSERLIEGECPGCQYHEPMADGGVSWYDLTGFKRDLLRATAEMESEDARMAGLDIKERLEEWYSTEIHHGRLYPNLDDLVRAGLLEKGEIDRRTNSYELTPSAITMLREQREAWTDLSLPEVAMADGGMAEPEDAGSEVGDDETPTWREISESDAFETTARVEDPISFGTAVVDGEGRLEVGEEFAGTEVDFVLAEAAAENGGEGE